MFIVQAKEILAQKRDSNINNYSVKTLIKPEILTSGFIDIINNGQVNASARFIRLFIGEPGKFAIPLSIYSGVSANNFSSTTSPGQNQQPTYGLRNNEHLVNGFINPLSGLLNVSADGIRYFKKQQTKLTKAGCGYSPVTEPGWFPTLQPASLLIFLTAFLQQGCIFKPVPGSGTMQKMWGYSGWLVGIYSANHHPNNLVKSYRA